MTEPGISDEALRLGLLMEAAQAQQRLAEESLDRLAAHTRELETVVRDEIRRTLGDELEGVECESRRAAQSLQRLRRAATLRVMLWTVSIAAVCSAVGLAEAWWMLPSRQEMAALRARRDALAANITRLREQGGAIDLRRCGDRARLCVQVDRHAPAYGAHADYLIVKGY